MPRFIVDFELAGHIEVVADDEKEAVDKVSEMSSSYLIGNVQNFNVGRNYIEQVEG